MMRILLTRPIDPDPLAALLAARGYDVAAVPVIATEPVPGLEPVVAALPAFDWVVVTSSAAVAALQNAASGGGTAPLPVDPPRWAAVGPATARALEAAGVRPAAVPLESRGAAIPEALAAAGSLEGVRVLLPRADAADRSLPDALRARGAAVEEVVAYRTVEGPATSLEPFARVLARADLAAAVVASGSAARGLVRLAVTDALAARLADLALVSIGPSTSAEVRRLGLRLVAEAEAPTPEALAEAVASAVPLERAASPLETAR